MLGPSVPHPPAGAVPWSVRLLRPVTETCSLQTPVAVIVAPFGAAFTAACRLAECAVDTLTDAPHAVAGRLPQKPPAGIVIVQSPRPKLEMSTSFARSSKKKEVMFPICCVFGTDTHVCPPSSDARTPAATVPTTTRLPLVGSNAIVDTCATDRG